MARTIAASLALLVLGAVGPATTARAEAPGLFVLPVKTDRWGGSSLEPGAARLLEARLVTALARGGRVRALGPRDVPAAARADLPRDLATCIAPACLEALGRATRCERVLAVELLEEEQGPILFATLYDADGGEVLDRRELPLPPTTPATRGWAAEVARWASGAPAPHPTLPPTLTVDIGAQQAGRPEAQALRLALLAHLQERAWPLLASPQGPGGGARTHRALITIENVAISERVHHVHRYRRGVLVARVDVADARGGGVLWSRRESADLTARSEHRSNQQMVDALVADVASRLGLDLQDPGLERVITRPDNKGEP